MVSESNTFDTLFKNIELFLVLHRLQPVKLWLKMATII